MLTLETYTNRKKIHLRQHKFSNFPLYIITLIHFETMITEAEFDILGKRFSEQVVLRAALEISMSTILSNTNNGEINCARQYKITKTFKLTHKYIFAS